MTAAPPTPGVAATRVVGRVLAAVIVVGSGLSLLGPTISRSDEVVRDLPVALQQVAITGGADDMTVRATPPGQTPTVRARLEWSLTQPAVRIDARDGGADVTLRGDCQSVLSWFGRCATGWQLAVPPATSVRLRSGSGALDVRGTSGPLELRSSSGRITVQASGSDDASVSASSGDVLFGSAVPISRLRATTSSGDIAITVPDDRSSYRVTTSTRTGEVDNTVGDDPTASRSIEATTSSGDITIRRG